MRNAKADRKAAKRLNEDTSHQLDKLLPRLQGLLQQLREEDEVTDPTAPTVAGPPAEDGR